MKEVCDVSILFTCASSSILISLQSIISQTNCRLPQNPLETVIYLFFNKFSCSNDARVYEKQMVCCVLCDIYYSW